MCKAGNRGQGFAVYSTGRLRRAGIYVHLRLIHIVVWQKPAQRCRAVIRRLKIKKKKETLYALPMAVAQPSAVTIVLYLCMDLPTLDTFV